MLKNCNEEDFYELKSVSEDRLDPTAIAAFLCATFIFGIFILVTSINAVYSSRNVNTAFWIRIIAADIITLIIQIVSGIFFAGLKNSYAHQKVEVVLLCIFSIKMSIEAYACFFLYCEDKQLPDYVSNFGEIILIGGLVFIVISTLRGIYRVKRGHFRKGGKYLYDFKNSKIYISTPLIYGLILSSGFLSRNISGSYNINSDIMYAFFLLVIFAVVQYGIAVAWPEFFLLAYCKFRFETFNEKVPKVWIEEEKKSKAQKGVLQKIAENLKKWYNKPILALKSWLGWKVKEKEKATNSVVVLVWFEISIVVYILLIIICAWEAFVGITTVKELINDLSTMISVALIFGFIINVIIIILLKFIKIVFKK